MAISGMESPLALWTSSIERSSFSCCCCDCCCGCCSLSRGLKKTPISFCLVLEILICLPKTIEYHISCITKKSDKMLSSCSWFKYLHIWTVMDAYYVNCSVYTCLSIFFFLNKRTTLWYNDVNRNIYNKKSTFVRQKSYRFFFFFIFCLFLLRLFLLVCSKEYKELDGSKLKSFSKNILLLCNKVRGLKPPAPVPPEQPCLILITQWLCKHDLTKTRSHK